MYKMSRVCINGRVGISRGDGCRALLLSPGVADPLPGWYWLLGRSHPDNDLSFSVVIGGARVSGIAPSASSRIIRDALKSGS
jgi:hypothetical protein